MEKFFKEKERYAEKETERLCLCQISFSVFQIETTIYNPKETFFRENKKTKQNWTTPKSFDMGYLNM